LNDYFSTSKSFQPIQLKEEDDLSNVETADALQTKQEERTQLKYLSSTTSLDERQPHLQQEQKAKGFLPSSPSFSYFLFPTAQNVTPLSDYDHSPPSSSFAKEQQHSSLHYEQPLNIEEKNNKFLLEQQKQKQSLISNQYIDLSDLPEENSSFSSTYSLSDTIIDNNDNDNQSHLLTSTPILPSHSSYYQTTNNNIFPSLLTEKNNSNKPLPLTLDSLDEHSSTISTVGLITDLQRKADVCQLNNMSSLSRYSSNFGTTTSTTHPYDQRISDQGNKYVIQIKTDEFQENDFTLTPVYSLNQLIIEAKHREEDITGGYIHRELRKIFNIPKHIDVHRHTYSYNTQIQELTIEMPHLQRSSITNENQNDLSFNSSIRNTTEPLNHASEKLNRNNVENILPINSIRSDYHNDSTNTSGIGTAATDSILMRSSNTAAAPTYESSIGKTKPFDFDLFHRSAFRPQIVRTTSNDNNHKKLLMSLDLSDYQAEDIKVSIKDRELIVKAERKFETNTRKSRTSFFQSTSLPPQTDIEHLQSNYKDGKLVIEAPYIEQNNTIQKLKSNHW
jgi:HSP20 family molecular chaperone IbpA